MKRQDLIELAARAQMDKNYEVVKQCTQLIGTMDGVEKSREGYAPINEEVRLKMMELQGTSLEDILKQYRAGDNGEA